MSCSTALQRLRTRRPLVHNITNYVAMEWTANVQLALGASPVMAHALDEVEEMTTLSGALVLNMGTLSPPWVEAMERARQKARQAGMPVILDPVGVGATRYRTETARGFVERGVDLVRGNGSELVNLAGGAAQTRGVDATGESGVDIPLLQQFAEERGVVLVATGERDLIVTGEGSQWVEGGSPLMARVTAMGCATSAVVAAFCAVEPDYSVAAHHALEVMARCGEAAARQGAGPGSFRYAFLDALYHHGDQ